MAGVRAKWAAPVEVRRLVREARGGLDPWEKDVVGQLARGSRILVVGCGAGREAVALAERGFRVTGIDFVEPLVHEARRHATEAGVTATFVATTAEELADRTPASFDAILSTAPVYEQIPGRARRGRFLHALARLAAPGALIVLCAGWHRDRGPRRAVVDGVRWLMRRLGVRGVAEPGDWTIYHLSMISDPRTSCFLHAFQRPEEIERELRAAGLAGARHPEGPWLLRIPAR